MDHLLTDLEQACPSLHHVDLPQTDMVAYCLEALWFLLFPDHRRSAKHYISGVIKNTPTSVLKFCREELVSQVKRALSYGQAKGQSAEDLVQEFLGRLPAIKGQLFLDAQAAMERDPAASSMDEVIVSYPGFLALMTYRLAHELTRAGVSFIPRMMSEYTHALTGCDIHPGARIGKATFIDHATGVVIGQTSVIGDRVTFFQGVTLGAIAMVEKGPVQRHPTIEDDVILYSHATILGGRTVIGARSVIGGSCWITSSVPPDSKIILAKPQMIVTTSREAIEYIPNWDI